MHFSITQPKVSTIVLSAEDLNPDLVEAILDDCREAGEFSSYLTTSELLFNRPDLAYEEQCMVIALPGITSDRIPPTEHLPVPVTLRRNGTGTTYLKLRDGKIMLAPLRLPMVLAPSEQKYCLMLYLFDDGSALDVIPITEELDHDICMHLHHAQSWLPDDVAPYPARVDVFQLPSIIERNIEVKPRSDLQT
ncbi:hypothetical protein [Paraburkholderia caribensis]|uniref:hypothetical protein n=1 Tax=Paraburkholderia caribensis TaxID=75105 RepID=UPI0034D3736E